jgi:DNA-binding transcriptional regulator YiaG
MITDDIKRIFRVNPDDIGEAAEYKYNCETAVVDASGDVWIEGPMRGHWLTDEDIHALAEYIEIETGQALDVWAGLKRSRPMTGREYKMLLKAAGVTQQQAAELLGISVSAICKRCRGVLKPRQSEIIALRQKAGFGLDLATPMTRRT